tara:strand:+ start:1792 stop:2022 length:231 start_codon:yes stop_codon:yes gene_type:complete
MKKSHIYFMNGLTFLVSLGVITMVANLLVHILQTDIHGATDFLAWMIALAFFLGASYLIIGCLILGHKEDIKNLNN